MNYLYLLSESENDSIFYRGCLSKITGQPYEVIFKKPRKTDSISGVLKNLPIFFRNIAHAGTVDNTFFLIAVDNDRSPEHPQHHRTCDQSKLTKSDQKKTCRFCNIESLAQKELDGDRDVWPIQGAIAVPVQTIESWQLLICNPKKYVSESQLPYFSSKLSSDAKKYYQTKQIPDQLKELRKLEQDRLNLASKRTFLNYCAEHLDPSQLLERSPSFKLFHEQVSEWKTSTFE